MRMRLDWVHLDMVLGAARCAKHDADRFGNRGCTPRAESVHYEWGGGGGARRPTDLISDCSLELFVEGVPLGRRRRPPLPRHTQSQATLRRGTSISDIPAQESIACGSRIRRHRVSACSGKATSSSYLLKDMRPRLHAMSNVYLAKGSSENMPFKKGIPDGVQSSALGSSSCLSWSPVAFRG